MLEALTADGKSVVCSASSGRPLFGLAMPSIKLAWSPVTKRCFMAVYQSVPDTFGKPNFITAELSEH